MHLGKEVRVWATV